MRVLSSVKARVTIAYAVLILFSSVLPGEGDAGWGFHLVEKINPTVQNLLHIPVYAVFAVLLDGSLPGGRYGKRQKVISVFIFCLLFGILNEAIQIPIPGRYAGVGDVLLNVIGAIIGIAATIIIRKD